MPPPQEPPWLERQYILALISLCGLVATLFTGAMAWWVRDISVEVKKVPVLEQRVSTLTDGKTVAEATIARLQAQTTAQAQTQALLEQRLGFIDQSLREVSAQLRLIATRLQGGTRNYSGDVP